jgi:two-component system sensor histidine kinase/response regulator
MKDARTSAESPVGKLASQPPHDATRAPRQAIFGEGPALRLLRVWLIAVVVCIPIVMGAHAYAVSVGWILPFTASIIATLLVLTSSVTGILWSANKLHRADLLLRKAHAELEQRVGDRTRELALANQALNRDIADRRRMDDQLRASRERLRAVTESAVDPILTVDTKGHIVQWNYAATQVFGYPESAILGANLGLLIPELALSNESAGQFAESIASWLGQTRRCSGHPSAGGTMDLEISVATWRDRADRFYSIIGRDVTARSRAEQELTVAKEAAEAANSSKSQFLANMSHEIRTPMNVMLGMAELIGEGELSDDQRRYLRSTREAGDHLLEIINDILDLSKVEAGALVLDEIEFDVREVAEQAVEFLAPRAYARHLEVACRLDASLPQTVMGDPQRLRQILVNLLGNAVKFTDCGHVALSVEVATTDRLRFTVADTGCGIPQDKLGVIFDSFTQVDASSTRRHGGTGLGLAISRQLVEQMGGEMRVESTVDAGSKFQVELPLPFRQLVPLAAAQEPPADAALVERLRQCRAIVAGGQTVFRQALGVQLAQTGAVVTEIASFSELLPHLRAAEQAGRPCDLLLIDADMGELDGYEAARQVTQMGLQKPPRIALTKPSEDSEDTRLRRETGVAVIIRKPVRQKSLLDALALALGTREPRPTTSTSQSALRKTTPRSILVVDDATDNLRLMEAFLRETGWRVETADDGKQAVDRWRLRAFDVILMDLQMPVMDGLAATREIRRMEHERGLTPTPVIAVTAHALTEARAESLRAGCTAFLAKPLRRAVLLDALTELFFAHPPVSDGPDVDASPIEITVEPLLMTLIPGFLQHRQEDITKIEDAIAAGDFAIIQLLGHSMKGSGGSYGFDVISRIGRDIELGARGKNPETIRQALASLGDYLRRVQVR